MKEFGFAYLVAQLGEFLFCIRLIVALRERRVNLVELLEGIWIVAVAVIVWSLVRWQYGQIDAARLAWIGIPLLASPLVYHVALRRKLRPFRVPRYSELANAAEKTIAVSCVLLSALLLFRFVQVTLRQLGG